MPKISLDIPSELLGDLKTHVGDEKKFISLADAIRTACRKMLDQLEVPQNQRHFSQLGEASMLVPGTPLPAPRGIFPRYSGDEETTS